MIALVPLFDSCLFHELISIPVGIRWALLLNKIDIISPDLTHNVTNVYKDPTLKEIMIQCAARFGANEANILPMKVCSKLHF